MTADTTATADRGGTFRQLLNGQGTVDFIGRSRLFAILSLAVLAVCAIGVGVRGLNFGIEFTGGTSYTVPGITQGVSSEQLRDVLADVGVTGALVQLYDDGTAAVISTPALEEIGGEQQTQVTDALAEVTGAPREEIAIAAVGPRWGQQITAQALRGLAVFLVLVAAYLSFRFEWRMALAALVTMLHDTAVTVGVYALLGFEVTPASVIAFLTILGYSLYDTVVVFDRVDEDTARLSSVSTVTYGDEANRALNEVLIRSLSTGMTALLPVGALLFIGANLLGADTLTDLALALFVGMAIGTYSSVTVATPLLVVLKEREPRWAELKRKVKSRGSGDAEADTASRRRRR